MIFRLSFSLAICLVLSGCTFESAGAGTDLEIPTLRRGDLVRIHLLTGELEAERAVDLVAPPLPSSTLELRWFAEEGEEVKAGDSLVEFDNTSVLSAIDERRVRLVEEENRLASASADAFREEEQAGFDLAEKRVALEKARLEAEVPRDLLTGLEFQEKQLALRRAELQFQQAEEALVTQRKKGRKELAIRRVAVRKAELELRQTLESIERLTLKAPREGIFLLTESLRDERKWQVGDTVWSGQVVARLPDLESLRVRARLFDVDEGKIRPEMAGTVVLDAYPELRFEGTVRTIDPLARQVSRESTRRSFDVLLDLASLDLEHMRPGMSVLVRIEETVATNVLLAPRDSLMLPEEAPARAAGEGAVEGERSGPAELLLAGGGRRAVHIGACNPQHCVVEGEVEVGLALAGSGGGRS